MLNSQIQQALAANGPLEFQLITLPNAFQINDFDSGDLPSITQSLYEVNVV